MCLACTKRGVVRCIACAYAAFACARARLLQWKPIARQESRIQSKIYWIFSEYFSNIFRIRVLSICKKGRHGLHCVCLRSHCMCESEDHPMDANCSPAVAYSIEYVLNIFRIFFEYFLNIFWIFFWIFFEYRPTFFSPNFFFPTQGPGRPRDCHF